MVDLEIYEHYSLQHITTFRIGGTARYFIEIYSVNELLSAVHFLQSAHLKLCVLGGGSNLLVSDRGFDGLVLKMNMLGKEIVEEDEQSVLLKVAAGEPWDALVMHAVNSGWWGIENLSFIPGNVGAFVIQNVGAYGQEASDTVEAVEVYDIPTGKGEKLLLRECKLAYRTSIFNTRMKGRYIILNTFFRLKKCGKPELKYRDLHKAFEGKRRLPTLQEIRKAVIDIRKAKLPDVEQIGSAGSFFKNLFLTREELDGLCARIAQQLGYSASTRVKQTCKIGEDNQTFKLPTALLLDLCGLRGCQIGGAALYHKHPLIVVNATGKATASDVMKLARRTRHTIYQNTGQHIVPEPTLIGFKKEELRDYFGLAE